MAKSDLLQEYSTGNKSNFAAGKSGLIVSNPDTSIGGKLAYVGQNTAAGLAGVLEGVGKLVKSTAAKLSGNERLARYYAKKSHVGEWQADLAEKYSPDKVTQFIADAGAGVGQSSVFFLPYVGAVAFTAGVGGNSLGDAVEKTGSLGFKEYAYAGLSAGAEMLMEKVSGATFKAVRRVGSAVSGSVTKNATTAASKTASKGMIKAVASNGVLKDLLSEASGEFLEEFLGDYVDVGLNRLTGVDPEASTTFTQALYSGMVGFASGGFMSGGSIVINRAAAASRGYHIQESGNADTLVKTANVVLEESQAADGFRDPLGMVDLLKKSVEAYESRADKTDYGARVALGQIQMYTAEIEKNIGVGQAYASIMNADAETMRKYAQLASLYTGETVTEQDLRANKNGIAEQMAVRDWVNGVLTVNGDIISEAEISNFTRSLYAEAQQTAPRFETAETAEGATRSTAVDISDADFDTSKRVQNVRAADGLYLSMRRNADGTYDYRVTNTAEERADGWDARGVPEEEMRQSFEQLKQASIAQKQAQSAEKTAPEAEAKAEKKDEAKAEEKKEKPRNRTEIDKATTEKLSKLVRNYTALSYTDRVAIARMVKTAEAMDVNAKTVKGIAVAMSTRRGLDIRFTDAIDQNGAWQVMEKSGRRLILINPNSTASLHQTVIHEYLHDVMGDSAKVKEAVIKATEAVGGDSFEAYIQENYDAYFDAHQKAGNKALIRTEKDGTVTRSFATDEARERFDSMMREEAAANYGAKFLARRSYLDRIADANANALVRAWSKMKRWISDVKAKDLSTARMMERYTQSIAKYVGSTYAEESTMASVVKKGDGVARYSFSSMANTFFGDEKMTAADFESRGYKQTEGYKAYVDLCLKNMAQTRSDFNEASARTEIEGSIDGIVKVALAMKKAGYDILDTAGKDARDSKGRLLFSSLEPNSDYFTSHDISTICDKRKNFAEIYDAIVLEEEKRGIKHGKRFFDNVDNYFYIHKVLAEKGLTQPCRECYVESMRKNLAPMATAFVRLVNETDPNNKKNALLWNTSGKSKGKPKETNTKIYNSMQRHLAEYGMTADQLTVDMLSTADGLAELKTTAPLIYETFNSFYGQAKPKMPKQATPFRFGELTALLTDERGKIKQSLVDKINETGGFRFQSYSDFQIQNWADVLQVIFEAGTLGLSGHAYTKVPAFLDATAGTNLKRNISIFMYNDGKAWKLDRNDSFPMKLDDIYKLVKADESGNTGIIAVSQNEHMSAWVMANDDIAYFIPFHKSGLKMDTVRETIVKENGQEIKGYAGIKDHTKQQSEVWKETTSDHKANTKVKKPISIYSFWDFDNVDGLSQRDLIEKNVKRYIDECERVGYIPRFREYIMNNGEVLKDVLQYSKELGFADKSATVSDISFEHKGYTVPYGYYKCLVDFSIFKPNGEASPHDVLSLKGYDFDKAAQTFSDKERIRRTEILQQFANGEEREKYRNSDMNAEELAQVIEQRRKEIAEEIVESDKSPRFELSEDRGYSKGQAAKIVANASKSKVYSKAEAEAAIDNVTALVSNLTSEENVLRKADIRGKSRAEVIDYLWERMNAAQEKDRLNVALNTAEYLINNAIVKEEYDGYGAEEYHRLVNDVNEISHWKKKFFFDETVKSELRYTFDDQYKSVIGSWFSKNGFAPSVVLQELRESGVQILSDTAVEAEIFEDIVAHYDNAKASLEMWNDALLKNVAEGFGKSKLKSEMAHEILRAFDTMGEKSAYRKGMEAQQQRIADLIEKQREKLKAARKRPMAEVRLFRDAIALEDLVKRNRKNHTFLQDPRVQELAKMASKIGKPRNARNPASVMTWAKGMSDIYSPTNPLMQIDGENDTYADPVVVEALRRLSQIDEKAKHLTDEQIIDLQTAVSGLKRLYTEYDTVFFEGKRVSLTETANKGIDNFRWIAEQNAKKGKKNVFIEKSGRFGKDYLYMIASPLSVIADMEMHDPNGVLTKAYQAVVNGQLRSQVQLATLAEPFERFYKENKGYRKSLARETVEFNGMTLTKAQAISLYCTMKREHSKLGLETFGIQYTDANGNTINSGKFGKVDPAALYEKFNATDKKFVEKVENFFNKVSKDVKSEADMRILGSTNVLDEYYFPILRDSMQKVGSMTDMRGMLDSLQTVARMSFNQNTVNKADGRLVIQDVTNVIDRHMQGLAIYANMYEELQAFNRIYNKNVIPLDEEGNPIRSEMRSVRETLEQTHKGANRYLKKLMADIQGVRVGEVGKLEPMLNAMTGLFAQAAISGNLKTALLPMASLPAAGLHIDAKYLMKSLASDVTASEMKAAIAQMDEYSIITKGRYMNRGAIRAQSMQSEVKGLIAATGKGIEITERFMMSKIWIAAKLQTAAETGLAVDSKENLQQAAALFDKTVTETQSQYISSMKSDMARSNNPIVRGFTMFKSDAAAMFSYNFDAFRKYAHLKERESAGQDVKAELDAAKKQLPRAVGSMAASSIAFALIAQLVRFAFNQDDDDDKPTAQQILENSLGSMVSMFPIVADVYDYFVSGYEMSSFVLDGFNSAVGSVKSVIDLIGKKDLSQGDIAKAVRSAFYSFGALAGIPVRNMTNFVTGVIRRISKPTMYAYDSLFSGERYAKDLAAAVEKGDMKMADAVIKVMYERDKSGAYDEDTLNEVLRLYQAGYSSVLPSSVSSKVKVNGVEIDLSSDQLNQFKKVYQGADGTIQTMLKSKTYNSFTDDQKAKAIKSVYTAYKSYAVYQATGQTDDKSAVMMQALGAEKFATARAYISGTKAAAETPKEGWKEALRKGLKSQGLSSKEISAILYAAGYRGEDELKALLSILNGKSLSSDEMKMIADILGLKVKNGKLVQGE